MPIDIEEFENTDPEDLASGDHQTKGDVLNFLAFNPKSAYTRGEIHAELDLSRFEIAKELSKLQQDGLVRQKGSYWIVTSEGLTASEQ